MKIEESAGAKAAKVNLLTQEIKFAKLLAGNDPNVNVKEKQLKKLRTWLKNRASCSFSFTNNDCLRIWKGLFYSMWMSDKPLPQENLANQIASLIHCFENAKVSIQFFAMFLKTMGNEWNGIDQWRIDKFMMLVRRVTREMFIELQQNEWDEELIKEFVEKLKETVLEKSTPRGLFMHFTEIYLEEVAKVTAGKIEPITITQLLDPYILYLATQSDYKLIRNVVRNVFNFLLFQSELGREYKEKYDAWKAMGFPGNSINDIALEPEEGIDSEIDGEENGSSNDEDEECNGHEDRPLDPRAGRVDVVMPEIVFDAKGIAKILEQIKYKKFTRAKNRKTIDRVINTYNTFASGTFPIGIQKININRDELELPSVEDKAEEFLEFEENLFGEQRKLKQMCKRKRKRTLTNSNGLDEHERSSKIAKIKKEANSWIEEDMPQNSTVYPDVEENKTTNGKVDEVDEKQTNNKDISVRKLKKSKLIVRDENDVKSPIQNGNVDVSKKLIPLKEQKNSPKALKSPTPKPTKSPKITKTPDEWSEPLKEGETEFFIPSKKSKANLSITKLEDKPEKILGSPMPSPTLLQTSTPVSSKMALSTSVTSSGKKNVKIVLKMNRSQEATEYIRQLKQSPNLPFDSNRKPLKGVLKPNLMPSPINPFYKKMIGLK